MAEQDQELNAMRNIVRQLESLDEGARARVLGYVNMRFATCDCGDVPQPADEPTVAGPEMPETE